MEKNIFSRSCLLLTFGLTALHAQAQNEITVFDEEMARTSQSDFPRE